MTFLSAPDPRLHMMAQKTVLPVDGVGGIRVGDLVADDIEKRTIYA